MRAEASRATILQAGRKQEKARRWKADRRRRRREGGEGRLAKGRISTGREKDDHFASWTKVGKSEEMESRPPPVAEGGRRRALSKREKCERKRAVRPFCKLDRWFESNRGSHVGAKFALLRFCFLGKIGIRGLTDTSLSLPNCRFAPETQKCPKPFPAVGFRGDSGRFLSI